jgi:hypothetical protein
MVRFYTLQEKIKTILYKVPSFWYITVRGTPEVSVIADAFFLLRMRLVYQNPNQKQLY